MKYPRTHETGVRMGGPVVSVVFRISFRRRCIPRGGSGGIENSPRERGVQGPSPGKVLKIVYIQKRF